MPEQMLVRYSIADAEIAKLAAQYMPLAIADVKDKKGFELVHSARMDVRDKRVMVEKTRVALKADALSYGKKVDSEAKRLVALLDPIERHLEKEEEVYTAEIERKRKERESAAAARLQERITDLQAFGAQVDLERVKAMTDEEFAVAVQVAEDTWHKAEAERKRIAEEAAQKEAEMQEERERLAQEQAAAEKATREANAAKAEAEKAIRDAQEAERAALAKVQAEKDKAAAVEKARIEEAARIKLYEETRAKQEAAIAKAEQERKEREESLRPEKEKILALADKMDHIAAEIAGAEDGSLLDQAQDIIFKASISLRKLTVQS